MGMDIFNNKVIARFACRQKRHDLKAQQGRSMIEMLGVLAIIGVLSVGGLVGYSKAMERYRINETINQISHIVQNTRDLFKTQPNLYYGLSFDDSKYMSDTEYPNRKLDDKAKIFPTSLVKNDYKDLFGGKINFFASGKFAKNDGKAFVLTFYDIPQKACIELATRDWQSGLGLVAMKVRGSTTSINISTPLLGRCTSSYKQGEVVICGKDMPLSIEQAVKACDIEKANWIAWKFY